MIYIGIDPGTHTGLAAWDTKTQAFTEICTLQLHRALDKVRDIFNANDGNVVVVFEDARRRKWLPREKSWKEAKGRAMGAGSVKRDSAIWEEFLEDSGIGYTHPAPGAGRTKWDADTFARVTGWTGRTSNHARDAALLVWGMGQKMSF